MKIYLIRVAKYVLQLTILFIVFFSVLHFAGYGNTSLTEVLTSERGLIMLAIIVVFALLQPFFGYTKKRLLFDANKRAEDLDRVMAMCGYAKISDENGVKTYRASNFSKKLILMFEDQITVTTIDEVSEMAGPRKEVVKAYFRMNTFIG